MDMIDPSEPVSTGKLLAALDWIYAKSLEGFKGIDSAHEIANEYMNTKGTRKEQTDRLIRWQVTKAGTSGLVTGSLGLISMPVTVPANVASVMYVQIRMIAAIAIMGGHNVRDDRIKALVYACLTGNAIKDVLKDTGIVIGTKLATKSIENISAKTIVAINQKIGFRLLTKFGEKGAVNLWKIVPLVGGVIGGTIDATTTKVIGNVARKTFIDDPVHN
jgi:uncharacterized protein (DUF697 family)